MRSGVVSSKCSIKYPGKRCGISRRRSLLVKLATHILILMAAFVMSGAASTARLPHVVPPDDGFDPGLFLGVLFVCAVLLVLVGIGIVIGLASLACAAIFVAFGLMSSSALVAIFSRRFSAGLRALHYQLSALVGLPCGIGTLWLGCLLFDFHLKHRCILAIGSVIGIIAGIAIAIILDRFFRFVYRRFVLASELRVST